MFFIFCQFGLITLFFTQGDFCRHIINNENKAVLVRFRGISVEEVVPLYPERICQVSLVKRSSDRPSVVKTPVTEA
jgi:hypothetical protein